MVCPQPMRRSSSVVDRRSSVVGQSSIGRRSPRRARLELRGAAGVLDGGDVDGGDDGPDDGGPEAVDPDACRPDCRTNGIDLTGGACAQRAEEARGCAAETYEVYVSWLVRV